MRAIVAILILAIGQTLNASAAQTNKLSEAEDAKIAARLRDYLSGAISFDEISRPGSDGNLTAVTNLVLYYQAHSNSIKAEELLPISRCLLLTGKSSEAASAVFTYINVHTNDCRAWDILFAAKLQLSLFSEAVEIGTNSLRFGCEKNLVPLGMLALQLRRDDIIKEMVIPRLLRQKDTEKDVIIRREILNFLVAYSVEVKDKELYVRALDGVEARDLGFNQDLRKWVKKGCQLFKAKETEKLCGELK